jgi:steroid delta-isomerase-like uncharacterized protein
MKRIILLITVISFVGLAQIVSTHPQSDQGKARLEQNKAVVRGYMENVLNKGDLAAFDNYASDDVLFNNTKGLKQQIPAMFQALRAAFPDVHLTIEDQIAEGDKVATRVTFHGTHEGEWRGVPPTGKQVAYQGIAIDRIVNGKVVEMWHEADTSGMLRQIGAAPSPSQPKK